jgi:elongation factor P
VDLPASVVLKVVETEPGARGNTVTNVFKPAKLETGLVVKVPLFINIGDKLKVDTRTREFISRET